MKFTTIVLDGTLKSDLDWTKAKEKAALLAQEEQLILWKIDLGLFSELVHPFSNRSQFLSLCLSLDHFKKEIWPLFSKNSLGLLIYSGPGDYRHLFPWDDEQRTNLKEWLKEAFPSSDEFEKETGVPFDKAGTISPGSLSASQQGIRLLSFFCRDACVDYLNLLAANIPDEIAVFVELEMSNINDPALRIQLTSQEKYERLHILGQEDEQHEIKIAICLPSSKHLQMEITTKLNEALEFLIADKISHKVIPEATLITNWDGLDLLICCPTGIDAIGRRKLQGFCAAGGQIITVGAPIGLPHEISFEDWKRNEALK